MEIPIAALNQYDYCPHRCWRMFCLGEFVDNVYTLEGTFLHTRADSGVFTTVDGVAQYRNVDLYSAQHELVGKADLIEHRAGAWLPVEYKRGGRGKWGNDRIQVCAQGLCLEEMLQTVVSHGAIFYAASAGRVEFALDEPLRAETLAVIARVRTLFTRGQEPPAHLMPRCQGCSLQAACLPTLGERVARYREQWE
ncbi:CRISPR-associated protein Cas4 [Candidatus Cyanaurora vandensis]|uniref:CRISPR-associated protein Cas4 n=1 Tax=Candidatus Cyanaurora vandensis TaxID=2714958 RepID=UPI00257A06AC|nr:CRISPR-associated protein Cas4 [Candidatus Cyanaurora vandensis]